MVLTRSDETNLLLPLYEGVFEKPVWETFLHRLAARTGAQRVRLTVSNPALRGQRAIRRRFVLDQEQLARNLPEPDVMDPVQLSSMRPNRVYTLDELWDFTDRTQREANEAALKASGIGDARLMRVVGGETVNLWVFLQHEKPTFGAADSALLTSIAPHLATALATVAALSELRMRAEMAEESLAMLGFGQAMLDDDAHVLVGDSLGRARLKLPDVGTVHSGASADPLRKVCAELAGATADMRRFLPPSPGHENAVLLRPINFASGGLQTSAAAVATVRIDRREDERRGAEVLQQAYGLSAREAALAEALSRGVPLIDAGNALRLTPETARNYSKRIYAKTGTSGQADLVRLVLTSLAPLA